ncbi:hypothetical protein QJS66_07100 [Kocuria rhizophila]|nr:hypothetical protein QJS66_07100 [Kocuria rhizophila]
MGVADHRGFRPHQPHRGLRHQDAVLRPGLRRALALRGSSRPWLTAAMMAFLVTRRGEQGAQRRGRSGHPHRAAPGSAPGPGQGRHAGCCREEDLRPAAQHLDAELRRRWNISYDDAGPSAAAPPTGRDRHAVLHHGDFDTLEDQAVTIRWRDEMTRSAWAWTGVQVPGRRLEK